MENNNQNSKKRKSHLTGVSIIRVAAFAFAIVSWYATAAGLSAYVFGPGWQAGCVSFGIQAILFVFNLKLPFYYNRIGKNLLNREQKKSFFKATSYQRVVIIFYIAVLLSSSFFSFVYICNYVVYEHQSGYADDNAILSSIYRSILNDTDDYIKEDRKATQILASKLLGELKEAYPVASSSDEYVSLEELNEKLSETQDEFNIINEDYELAKTDAKAAKDEMDGYLTSRNNTTWHNRQDEWQKKYEEAKTEYEAIKIIRDQKEQDYKTAKKALTAAENAVKNYKKSQDTVVSEFLLEMLKPSPDTTVLEQDINELNTIIVELGESGSIVDNYSDLVGKTQMLTVVVKDYISLSNTANANGEDSVEYLLEHAMDDVVAPDPSLESFAEDCTAWRKGWEIKLNILENIIQHLPKFSKSEKAYLSNSLIDAELLSNYIANDKIDKIDELKRNKISDINVIEKATALLFGKYWFTAWFSFGLALFFDLCSLLAGLLIYGIQEKKVRND